LLLILATDTIGTLVDSTHPVPAAIVIDVLLAHKIATWRACDAA